MPPYVYITNYRNMKWISSFLLLAVLTLALTSADMQLKQQIFLQMVDVNGVAIRGTSVQRGYERQIIVTSFSGVTTGNPQVQFSFPSGGASATLSTMKGSKQTIPYAVFTVTEPGEARLNVLSTIRLESVSIIRVEDVNGSTNVTLQAARIGTTYFQNNLKTGIRTISGKTGFDYTTGQTWNSF